jgi:2-polyprenyl-3-methyl-5-hydroxy-6-metoxy-1,4-benzoquinol methylase
MYSIESHLLDRQATDQIRSTPCPDCYLCGATGEVLYESLKDRLFGAAGSWNMKRCPNAACGLLWLDPIPLEEDIPKAYNTYYTHEYAPSPPPNRVGRIYSQIRKSYLHSKYGYPEHHRTRLAQILARMVSLHPSRREIFDSFVFWLKSKPGGRLLEVGCGNGAMLKSMKDLGWQVEGVDFDPVAVEQARRKGLIVHLGSLGEQKLSEATFDAIAAVHLIEHVPHATCLLQDCHRLLKPGGVLVLVTPNAKSLGHRLYGEDWRGLEPPRHLRIFSQSSLRNACVQAGFRVWECRSIVRSSSILLESWMLQHTGGSDPARLSSWNLRLLAEVTSLFQSAISLVDREAGEEIVLVGSK